MPTRPILKPSKYSRRLLKVRAEISKVKSPSGINTSRIGSTGVYERAPERWDAAVTIFLSFCTVCEKQIVIPSDSILYCSESDIPGQHDSGELGDHPSITSRRTFPCLPIVDCPLRSTTTIEGTFEAANGEIFSGKSCSLPTSAAHESIKRLFLADMYNRGRS
ncbi:hypothetical protein DM02DRAFT_664614 [Periconia macrospinosa]|uniref:Uncharacterized protein n=1 Tax=Periconia macrospinosa TaxID=97972 RepID=A0A2V1CYV9_9PLEO|nr:hypothetical protein DM02DRAFT_664614 [Periconia macrospinosa]